ncbi:uncharacterized protein LOC118478025 [Aplysia californica]|uniref:Uncharacterized protein LOC118478025 n=1 Tax=Aplysia californica TaxID=6500 RepID=A0ABM1VWI6_APLCA|nr:uncharacterized protein LOC118478025 [Aplysia californica]
MEARIKNYSVSVVWLCFLALHLAVSESQASDECPTGWRYFSKRASCFKLFSEERVSWSQANRNCQEQTGGPNNSTMGVLARVFDKETDEYLQNLLSEFSESEAWIGLNDIDLDNTSLPYRWDFYDLMEGDYTGWKAGASYNSDGISSGVITTPQGWEEKDYQLSSAYICQIDLGLPDVHLSCPPMEEGEKSQNSVCSFKKTRWIGSVQWQLPNGGVADCYSSGVCLNRGDPNFQAINSSTEEVRSTFGINTVVFGKHSTLMCTPEFITGRKIASCDLPVYVKPSAPRCEFSYTAKGQAHFVCVIDKVYPGVACEWSGHLGIATKVTTLASGHKKVRCELVEDLRGELDNYLIKVYPQLNDGTRIEEASNEVTFEMPDGLVEPEIFDGKGNELTVIDFDTDRNEVVHKVSPVKLITQERFTVKCVKPPGSLRTISTSVHCDDSIRDVDTGLSSKTAPGRKVQLTFKASESMDGKSCKCISLLSGNESSRDTSVSFSVEGMFCDFESNKCGIECTLCDGTSWIRASASADLYDKLPKQDYGSDSSSGYFLYAGKFGRNTGPAILKTRSVDTKDGGACLSFVYFSGAGTVAGGATLTVFTRTHNDSKGIPVNIFGAQVSQGQTGWREVTVEIPGDQGLIDVFFQADQPDRTSDPVVIDDIYLRPGPCSKP